DDRQVVDAGENLLLRVLAFDDADAEAVAQAGGADADEAEHRARERVGLAEPILAALGRDEESVLFPGPAAQRKEAMTEENETVAEGVTLGPLPLAFEANDHLGVMPRQDAARAGHAEEGDEHLRGPVRRLAGLQIVNRAGGKRERLPAR